MEFLKSDLAKKILFMLAIVAGGLQQVVEPGSAVFQAASVVLALLAGLGIVSGGTKSLQPSTVVQVPTEPKLPPAA